MSAAIVDWWGKIIKFHWRKHPKAVPKTKLEPENRLDFLAWSLKANKKLAKKINHFIIQLRSKNLTYFTNLNSFNIAKNTPRQHSQRLYSLHKVFSKNVSGLYQKHNLPCSISRRPRTALSKCLESKCLYIPMQLSKEIFLQLLCGGRLNTFLWVAHCCLGLVKCF